MSLFLLQKNDAVDLQSIILHLAWTLQYAAHSVVWNTSK